MKPESINYPPTCIKLAAIDLVLSVIFFILMTRRHPVFGSLGDGLSYVHCETKEDGRDRLQPVTW